MQGNLYIKYVDKVLAICYNNGMNVTQTVHPESIIVLRDGQLDDEYYDQVYEDKRREALEATKQELIQGLIGVPAKMGRAVVYLFSKMAEQANG